jgi:hypothetical protein
MLYASGPIDEEIIRLTKLEAGLKNPWGGLLILALVAIPVAAAAQNSDLPKPVVPMLCAADLAAKVPAPKPSDVHSSEAIIKAAYDSISGPAGKRDWNRFRSLFLPQARFTEVSKGPDGKVTVLTWGVDEFVQEGTNVFAAEPFYENGIVNRPEGYGNMLTVLSSYESHHAVGDKPFARGVNSFQLLSDGTRWWIISIFWDSERADNPLPAKFQKKS